MELVINKLMHCPVEIKVIEANETKPARYQVSISDSKSKTYSKPSIANSFEQEIQIVLEKFYNDIGYTLPVGFDIHPLKKGWVAIEKKK